MELVAKYGSTEKPAIFGASTSKGIIPLFSQNTMVKNSIFVPKTNLFKLEMIDKVLIPFEIPLKSFPKHCCL